MLRAFTFATVAFIWLSTQSATIGQLVRSAYQPGFVELSPGAIAADADVTWIATKPADLEFREYLTKSGKPVCVLHLQPGEYILVSDVIDWDARKRTRTTHVITVGDGPTPTPIPPKPIPDTLTGFAGEVQLLARTLTTPRDALIELGRNFESVASQIAGGGITSREAAEKKVAELNKQVTPRLTGVKPLADLIHKHLEQNARDLQGTLAAFRAIAEGLAAI